MERTPHITIGMPVYNGERYVGRAIESILAQTMGDFELIVSDNASEDATVDICMGYARRDARVRVRRRSVNAGAAANFNDLVKQARGSSFKWAAHDDVLAPGYLEVTSAALAAAPDAVAAHSRVAFIDAADDVVRHDPFPLERVDEPHPSRRFADAITTPHWSFWAFALCRVEALRRTDLIGPYASSDRVLIAHLALLGRFVESPEVLFFSRDHPERALRSIPEPLRRRRWLRAVGPLPAAAWYDPARAGSIAMPQWNLWRRYAALPGRCSLAPAERLRCYASLLAWPGRQRNAAKLARDLLLAAEHIARRDRRGDASVPDRREPRAS